MIALGRAAVLWCSEWIAMSKARLCSLLDFGRIVLGSK